jgi:hypothetical protein
MTIDMKALLLIFFIALVVPLIVETIKKLTTMMLKKWCWELIPKILQPVLNSVLWTILLCFTAKAGIFTAFGFALIWPWLDYLVTGLVASLGVEKLYSLVTSMKEYKEKLAVEKSKE